MLRRALVIISTFSQQALHNPTRRFQLSLLFLLVLIVVGTVVYMGLEAMTVTDALYMTVITITTVGFGEVVSLSSAGRVFTIMLIFMGVGAATSAISNGLGIMLSPYLWVSIRLRTMGRKVEQIENHYIVCGFGRMGRQIIGDLLNREESFVLIDQNADFETEFLERGILHVIGNATQDEILLKAGIERAKGLVAALNTDSDNVMTVLSARELNRKLFIVARVTRSEAESKLRRAGANRVVSPYQIGGHRISLALLRPAVNDFLDRIFHFEHGMDTDIGQLYVYEDSPLAEKTVITSNLRNEYNVNILAIQTPAGEIVITPNIHATIATGSTLIVIGPPQNIYKLEDEYKKPEK